MTASAFKVGDRVYHRRRDFFGAVADQAPDDGVAPCVLVKYEWPYDPAAPAVPVPEKELVLASLVDAHGRLIVEEKPPLDRFRVLRVLDQGEPMPGPKWCRVDCLVPGIGVEVWAVLVVMQTQGRDSGSRYTLEDLHPTLGGAGNPPLSKDQGEVVGWLVRAIGQQPIGDRVREVLKAKDDAEAAKSEVQKAEDLARARELVEKAAKRVRDSEVS